MSVSIPNPPTFPRAPLVLVGESNPYGEDPAYALFCEPRGSAGGRLQRIILGMPRAAYLELPRFNLCTGDWLREEAEERAAEILSLHPVSPLVLLGRNVARAFGLRTLPAFSLHREAGQPMILLPHPSGRVTVWNDPARVAEARALLARVAPSLPYGTVGTT